MNQNVKDIYLDNAATTMPYPEVVDVIRTILSDNWGNPSSLHQKGASAKNILQTSRATIAHALGVAPSEIYFTSGGTEANNLAIAGSCYARAHKRGNIITSTLEHASVTKAIRNLKRGGWNVNYINARQGNLDTDALTDCLNPTTTLISIMAVQNEIGYCFNLDEINRFREKYAPQALLHTDAVQLFGKLPFKPKELGVDLASLCAHKIGGPKGIGALYIKEGTKMFTTSFGGGQERGFRSGTEAPFLAAGFAKAVELCFSKQQQTIKHVAALKFRLEDGLRQIYEKAIINSRPDGSPYISSFTLPGVNGKDALAFLNEHHVFASAASACESNHKTVPLGTWRPKHPLSLQLAGISKRNLESTFRISYFSHNTAEQIDYLLELIKQYIALSLDSLQGSSRGSQRASLQGQPQVSPLDSLQGSSQSSSRFSSRGSLCEISHEASQDLLQVSLQSFNG
ncbi:MAG: cysteine desulfurase [Coriobacteriales bacterium]|jgi:cysteine desulfurase|nr:cysteine desulfurase [Coriobacteriales bacterium]